jgi:hypothetical protein
LAVRLLGTHYIEKMGIENKKMNNKVALPRTVVFKGIDLA